VSDRPIVLSLRALGLGDLLTAIPALRGVADAFPEHRKVLAAPRSLAALAVMSGAVDEIIDTRELGAISIDGPVDVAVNVHGRGPESHRSLCALQPRRLIAFEHPDVDASTGSPRWRRDEHEVARWCRLLSEVGIDADPRRLDLPHPAPPVRFDVTDATVVHPGAASAARRWPAARWAAVARAEVAAGHRVLVTGTARERPLATAIADAARLDPSSVLAGRTSVTDLAAIVANAGIVLSGDTGIAHLAVAFATPSVTLFGPTDPAHWGPSVDRQEHRVVWNGTTGDPHGDHVDPGLLRIGVLDVLDAVHDLRAARRPAEILEAAS
jgi:ADP-heptose:LPS heptosyltransferase